LNSPEYDIRFEGVGIPKNNDMSKGFCSQIVIFSKKCHDPLNSSQNDLKEKCYAEEIFSICYPYEIKNHENFLKILKQQYK